MLATMSEIRSEVSKDEYTIASTATFICKDDLKVGDFVTILFIHRAWRGGKIGQDGLPKIKLAIQTVE